MTEPGARVIDDSVSYSGDRITTIEVTHHRYILAETNTHAAIAKSSASTRAIPLEKKDGRGTFDRFVSDPAFPVAWNCEQSGMQGGAPLEGEALADAQWLFRLIHERTAFYVGQYLADHPDLSTRLHKSALGRLLEPYQWHTAIWTFDHNLFWNFLNQRDHPAAQPEFGVLSAAVREAVEDSRPKTLAEGEWHLPFLRPEDEEWFEYEYPARDILDAKLQVSIARCARTSYMNHDGVRDPIDDVNMYQNRLMGQNPPHAGPFEHAVTPAEWNKDLVLVPQLDGTVKEYKTPRIGKFYGFISARHMVGLP